MGDWIKSPPIEGVIISIVGTALIMVGIAYYAESKGRSPYWGLLGLLSHTIIGLIISIIILACLKDLKKDGV